MHRRMPGSRAAMQLAGLGYCTVREIVFVAVIVPEVPVTVMV
jgi:hypothetical protein